MSLSCKAEAPCPLLISGVLVEMLVAIVGDAIVGQRVQHRGGGGVQLGGEPPG